MNHSPPKARVVTDASGPSRQSRSVLVGLAAALFAYVAFKIARAVLDTVLTLRIRSADFDFNTDAIFAASKALRTPLLIANILLGAAIAAMVVLFAVGLWRASRAGARQTGPLKVLAAIAAAFAVFNVGVDIFFGVAALTAGDEFLMKVFSKRNLLLGLSLASVAGLATLVWALATFVGGATAWSRRVSWIGGLATAWVAGFTIYRVLDRIESPWWDLLISTAPFLAAYGSAGLLAWWGRRSVGPLPVAESMGDARMRWLSSSRSLGVYGTALLWRLVVAIGAYGLLYVAIESQSFSLVKFIGWSLPLAAVVLGGVMTFGIVGFANQPRQSSGRAPAHAAAAVMLLGSFIDLLLVVTLLRVMTVDRGDYESGFELGQQLEALGAIAPWAMILGFAALILLLASFRSVARQLSRPDLVKRAATVFALMLAASGTTIALRLWIASKPRLDQGEAMLVVVLILVVVSGAVASYLGLLRRLQECINGVALAPPDDDGADPAWIAAGGNAGPTQGSDL